MKREREKKLYWAAARLAAFALWTAAVRVVDVAPIGPEGTEVGFAALNAFVHSLTGVHLGLYVLTDWLSIVPLGFMLGFALLGLRQWIVRGKLRQVDRDILLLGGFYLLLLGAYGFFEVVVVNYRPVLLAGRPEASYPSSTTLLVLGVIPSAAGQLEKRLKNRSLRVRTVFVLRLFAVAMVLLRVLSGVHWITDIVGGALLSGGLLALYRALCPSPEEIA